MSARVAAAAATRRAGAAAVAALDWCGREVLAADAVHYYAPDAPPLRRWLGSKNRFGYPLVKALTLFSLGSGGGVMLRQIPLPHRRGEAPLLARLLRRLARPGAVVVADRAFASFANLHAVTRAGADAVIRIKRKLLAKPRSLRQRVARLGRGDHLVRWRRPHHRCGLLSRRKWSALPRELTLRQVSFAVRRRGWRTRAISLVTTLLDPQRYPAEKLAELYARRWEVETQFRHIKQTLNWESLRCRSVAGVKKELLLRQIAFNLVRGIVAARAAAQATPVDRISFVDALRWLLHRPGGGRRSTAPIILRVPDRPRRAEPRRLKRQDKNYLPLNCPRDEARRKAA